MPLYVDNNLLKTLSYLLRQYMGALVFGVEPQVHAFLVPRDAMFELFPMGARKYFFILRPGLPDQTFFHITHYQHLVFKFL